jgi:hypothetical protein
VNSHIRQIMKLTISLVLFGLLSGCMGGTPPKIDCTAEDSIGLTFYGRPGRVTPGRTQRDIQYDEALRLISEHCVGGYIETHRGGAEFSSYVYAVCLQEDGSSPVSPSCKYVAPDLTGFGESY